MEPSASIAPPISLTPVIATTPIYFVGDSNVLTFRGLLCEVPAFFAQPLVTTAFYIPGLTAANSFEDGALHQRIAAIVRGDIMMEPIARRDRRPTDSATAIRRQLDMVLVPPVEDEWNLPRDPAIVLMAGSLDLLWIVSTLGPAVDFHCNDERFASHAFPVPVLPIVSSDIVYEMIADRLAPLRLAVRALVAMGSTRLYLHSLHPPTLDDALYVRMRGAVCSAKLRYKVALAINRVFREIARSEGIGFLDMWDATTRDGVLDPRVSLDGDHLNRSAACATLETLLTALLVARAQPIDSGDTPLDLSDL